MMDLAEGAESPEGNARDRIKRGDAERHPTKGLVKRSAICFTRGRGKTSILYQGI